MNVMELLPSSLELKVSSDWLICCCFLFRVQTLRSCFSALIVNHFMGSDIFSYSLARYIREVSFVSSQQPILLSAPHSVLFTKAAVKLLKKQSLTTLLCISSICRATTGKGCPEARQKDQKSLADFSSNFTLFLDASLIIFSPHAR